MQGGEGMTASLAGTDAVNASFAALAARLQPDGQCVVYDADQTNPRDVLLVISNARSLTTTRVASKVVLATGPLGAPIRISDLVQYTSATDAVDDQWFVVADALIAPTGGLAAPTVQMHRLPYEVTRLRPSQAQRQAARDPWSGMTGATLAEAADKATIRLGFSNMFNPVDENVEGMLPRTGTVTAIVPLLADVKRGDTIILPAPDGRPCVVQDRNILYTDGPAWATQLQLSLSGGSGLTAP